MANEIFMPKLSSTMQVGTLLEWYKEEGDPVEIGEPLFEIMTDKINIEVESYDEGILLKRYYDVDAEIPVNTVIGYIGEKDEIVPDEPPVLSETEEVTKKQDEEILEVQESGATTEKVRATPAARKMAKEHGVALDAIKGSGANGRIHKEDVLQAVQSSVAKRTTPLAKKIALDNHIDINSISGSGVHGKIEKADVLNELSTQKHESGEPERIKLKGLRKMIADKMTQSSQSIPHVTLTSEVNMAKVIEVRKSLLPIIEEQTGYRLSYTEILMKAVAQVLTRHPYVNASLIDNEIILNQAVHIGLAVAVENGLIVPSVRDADKKGLAALTESCKELGKKARDNKLTPDDLSGGTFTISNLGMYAIDGFTPIINPPETAILGVGRIQDKPVVVNQSIEIQPMMVLSLSFDHRVIDGAPAAAFLTDLKEILENPYRLLV